jgi:hypothetical protein
VTLIRLYTHTHTKFYNRIYLYYLLIYFKTFMCMHIHIYIEINAAIFAIFKCKKKLNIKETN